MLLRLHVSFYTAKLPAIHNTCEDREDQNTIQRCCLWLLHVLYGRASPEKLKPPDQSVILNVLRPWYRALCFMQHAVRENTVLLTDWLTAEQGPSWEADSYSAVQEISCLSWKPKVHYRFTRARHSLLSWASWIYSTFSHSSLLRLVLILHSNTGLRAGWSGVRFPAGAGNFSLHHHVQNCSGAHPASYPMGTRGSFTGVKAAGARSWPLTSI
jgi:hypothetical protein